MTDTRNLPEIREAHPFPWVAGAVKGSKKGEVEVTDAKGAVVPLFTMLRLVEIVTTAARK